MLMLAETRPSVEEEKSIHDNGMLILTYLSLRYIPVMAFLFFTKITPPSAPRSPDK